MLSVKTFTSIASEQMSNEPDSAALAFLKLSQIENQLKPIDSFHAILSRKSNYFDDLCHFDEISPTCLGQATVF